MKRFVIMEIFKLLAKIIFLTFILGGFIVILGYARQWDSPIAYSNAFFLAGALMIIAGGMSRLAAGEDWNVFQRLSAESFRGMSSGERAAFIVNISSQLGTMLLGVLTGVALMILSAIAAYLF